MPYMQNQKPYRFEERKNKIQDGMLLLGTAFHMVGWLAGWPDGRMAYSDNNATQPSWGLGLVELGNIMSLLESKKVVVTWLCCVRIFLSNISESGILCVFYSGTTGSFIGIV